MYTDIYNTDTNYLLSRYALAQALGTGFSGKRNYYEVLGYLDEPGFKHYKHKFKRQGIAERLVRAYPDTCYQGGIRIWENENPETTTQFEAALRELDKGIQEELVNSGKNEPALLGLTSVLNDLDVLMNIGRYAVLMIGVAGDNGLNTALPLEVGSVKNPRDIVFLQPHSEETAVINTIDQNPNSKRFGLPDTYIIQSDEKTTPLEVHHSRVIHVAENTFGHRYLGTPFLESIYNDLDDLFKVSGANAETFWLNARQGLALSLDKDLQPLRDASGNPVDEGKAYQEQVDKYQHGLSRILRMRGLDAKTLDAAVHSPKDSAELIFQLISAAKGIPKRILTGSERGELASGQDSREWHSRVDERRDIFLKPKVARPLINRLIALGALPMPVSFTVEYGPLGTATQAERVALAKEMAATNKLEGKTIFTVDEIREVDERQPFTPEELAAMEAEALKKIQDAQAAMATTVNQPQQG